MSDRELPGRLDDAIGLGEPVSDQHRVAVSTDRYDVVPDVTVDVPAVDADVTVPLSSDLEQSDTLTLVRPDDVDDEMLWGSTQPADADVDVVAGALSVAGADDDDLIPAEPWGKRRWLQSITSWATIAAVTLFTWSQVAPEHVLTDAVPTGGDMGAHVWAPAYLRDHLLPFGKLSGWSMDWYGGLPVYRYYMLPPALLILLLDTFLPYGMAFKIVAVLGILALPVCCYAFGRLARFPYPIPALFALAGGIFLFDETFEILGGNIASTMAGEFSFSISLSLGVLGAGLFARGLENGRHRVVGALVIAVSALSHGLVALGFVAIGLFLMWLISADKPRTVYFLTTAGTGLAVAAFWFFPFILTSKYMTDMKYEPAPTPGGEWDSHWRMFFPHTTNVDRFWTILALIGLVMGIRRRHRVASWLGVFAIVLTALVFITKETDGIPGFGLLWNVRLLPFIYLIRYLLAMVGIAEVVWLFASYLRNRRLLAAIDRDPEARVADVLTGALDPRAVSARKLYTTVAALGAVALLSVGWLAWHMGKFPGQKETFNAEGADDFAKYRFEFLGIDISSAHKNGFVDGWSKHNFTGYEDKGGYAEYRALVDTMKRLGEDPAHGCGFAMWEHTDGTYGTPMALMLLPHWTDSCIGSMEGLFFEASASTPYTFIAKSAMSQQASDPVRGLTYEKANAEIGVRELQTLGVRYYMAYHPETVGRAAAHPDLVEVATSGPWHVYEVVGSDLVQALTVEPVVINERGGDQRERWLEVGTSYFQHPERWAAMPVADGPRNWQRVDVVPDEVLPYPQVDVVGAAKPIETRPLPEVTVSDVRLGNESVSFKVDRIGVPVVVKVSYFPNWSVKGATGPYRVAPNLMVVVPTSNEVRLTYGRSTIDYISYGASIAGLLALVFFGFRGRVRMPRLGQVGFAYPPDPDPFGPDPRPIPAMVDPWADWDENLDEEPWDEVVEPPSVRHDASPLPTGGGDDDPRLAADHEQT